ncbi:MAG: protein kinase [Acidobacteria bacterium]|nr:MAG: protein kinase [Acidobacteriota bacterium]
MRDQMLTAASTIEGPMTESGSVVGTIPYMSPEQLNGKELDARTDIFSFGIVLYQMLAGSLPFQGNSSLEIMASIMRDKPVPLSKLNPKTPPAFETVVMKALAKETEFRYSSIQQLLSDLKKASIQPASAKLNPELSVAVLYFENLGGEKETEYFRDGMTEDVITDLSKIKNLKIFPRSAVIGFRDKPATPWQIGSELNASHILMGTLRRSGNKFRITTQLVESRSGHSIWAERYDRQMEDVFALQDEIAHNITSALQITLSPQEENAIAEKPTKNTEAYDYYLKGRGYTRKLTESDLHYALQMYEHAVTLEPDFALAHAGISRVCSFFFQWFGEDMRWIEKASAACQRALSLEPELPEALIGKAEIHLAERNYDEAIRCASNAIRHKKNCEWAYFTLGRAHFFKNQWAEIAAFASQAIELCGDDYNTYVPIELALLNLGETERANEVRMKHIEVLKRQLDWVPEDARAHMLLAGRLAAFGKKEESNEELKKAIALRPNDPSMRYNAACAYGLLQNKQEALDCLEKAAALGFRNVDWAVRDPDLACLHSDERFQRLVQHISQSRQSVADSKSVKAGDQI